MSKPNVERQATAQKQEGQDHPLQAKVSLFQRHALECFIGLCLTVVILAVFWQVRSHEFINFDDNEYVTNNPNVKAGLTLKSASWAFVAMHSNNWHPLTWLSHMLDCELYGLNPGGHHLTNLLFHIANTLLLFLVLNRMTGALWRSSFVAALFALHPLHVESVAWVAERKDVLSTFFWMLTMWTYVRYCERRGFDQISAGPPILCPGSFVKADARDPPLRATVVGLSGLSVAFDFTNRRAHDIGSMNSGDSKVAGSSL